MIVFAYIRKSDTTICVVSWQRILRREIPNANLTRTRPSESCVLVSRKFHVRFLRQKEETLLAVARLVLRVALDARYSIFTLCNDDSCSTTRSRK